MSLAFCLSIRRDESIIILVLVFHFDQSIVYTALFEFLSATVQNVI